MPDQPTRDWARATEVVGLVVVVVAVLTLIGPLALAIDDLRAHDDEADGLGVVIGLVLAVPCVACLLLGLGAVRSIRRSRRLERRRPLVAAPILVLVAVVLLGLVVPGVLGFLVSIPVVGALTQIGPLLAAVAGVVPPILLLASGQDGSGRATSGPDTMSA